MRNLALLRRLNSTVRTGLLAGAVAITSPLPAQTPPDFKTVMSRAADGDVESQNALGNAFANATSGVTQDLAEALKWYRRAADKGFAPAQFNCGLAYELGRGVPADAQQAFKFYLLAAEQGFAPAQFNVGNMYSTGRGVGQDFFEANLWFKQAADGGVLEAQYNLGFAYASGNGVKKDEAQAARWYRIAADRGYVRAQYNLGLLLEDGRGVPQDAVAASVLYRTAAEQGFAPAQVNYGLMLSEGRPGVPADPVQAYVWLSRAVQNGAGAEARDALARRLAPEQVAMADRVLGGGSTGVAPTSPPVAVESPARAGNSGGNLVEQLREQNRRLSAQVESLTADKETSERQATLLTRQIKDLQQEKGAPAPAQSLAEESKSAGPEAGPSAVMIANLQRDNVRLNDEVKRATRELLSLNNQIRSLRSQAAKPEGGDSGAEQPARQGTDIQSGQVAALQQQLTTLLKEKTDLEQWSRSLEKTLNEKSASAASFESTLAGLRQQQVLLQQQLQERDQALERQTAAAARLTEANRELEARLTRAEDSLKPAASAQPAAAGELEVLRRRLEQAEREVAATRSAREQDAGEISRLKVDLAAALNDSTNVGALRDSLVQANAKVADLQRALAVVGQQAAKADPGADELKQQLAEANQALDKSGATVAELTAANEKLERELTAASRGAAETGSLRDELAKLRRAAAELAALREENGKLSKEVAATAALRAKTEQLTRDNEQLTTSINGNRVDLEKAQGRVSELEKQLAEALTVRTRNGNDGSKLQAELDETNQTVEKLNATVAELTVANEKLEKDLENAQKSTAAALAAQSQAVSAASPDAFQMEISTLNSRIKQLEAQVEEERSGAAREVSTLVSQLQRTRETNKSLTDANRALLSAKENDNSAVRDDIAQLEGRVRELTAANEELRRTGQKQAADLRSMANERESLQSQLVDARKVATVLPGLADEKVALQERLEAVGTQLVQLQRDQEEWQKSQAELSTQLAASRQAAEKAEGQLALMQSHTAEAEKAAEAHNASVAELTQANTRLETEREDMRRLVESYRGDIARLTQSARAAEQQKADAERSGQQNVDAVTAQMAQLRRELDATRANQARLTEAYATQERERAAAIAQLRTENGALVARLNQAQGTLDQIAAAARLGTPAATIASGGNPPLRSMPSATAEARFHTVAEGDSLSRISMRYYGTPNRWQEIFQANRDVLQGNSALRIGMQLRIP